MESSEVYGDLELSNEIFHLYTYDGERWTSHLAGLNDEEGPGCFTTLSISDEVDLAALAANVYFAALTYCSNVHAISDEEAVIMYKVMLNKLKAPYDADKGLTSDGLSHLHDTPPWE